MSSEELPKVLGLSEEKQAEWFVLNGYEKVTHGEWNESGKWKSGFQ
ncbi:unnamed protein product, partial [marine sediment metagenome]